MNYNNTNQPIINNAHEYLFTKKFLSIHSEDRDISKFPQASQFDIDLPQEYMNVAKVQLVEWSFPSNYYTFSGVAKNLLLSFQVSEPYNAAANGVTNPLELAISAGLIAFKDSLFVVQIEEGFYNPFQMSTELTNQFNKMVTDYLNTYFISISLSPVLIEQFNNPDGNSTSSPSVGGYKEFVVFYNIISQKLHFGNRSSRFIIPNMITPLSDELFQKYFYLNCTTKKLPQFTDSLLLFNLGFSIIPSPTITLTNQKYARVYYDDSAGGIYGGNDGIWLTPSTDIHPGCNASYLIPNSQINFMGPSHFYLDIKELNNMDE